MMYHKVLNKLIMGIMLPCDWLESASDLMCPVVHVLIVSESEYLTGRKTSKRV